MSGGYVDPKELVQAVYEALLKPKKGAEDGKAAETQRRKRNT